MSVLSHLYGSLAARRRRWYTARPDRRRRLEQPVVSVGALAAGGSGKTPLTAHVAELLAAHGERPAVLSRGYGRRRRLDGVVVVRDRSGIRATLAAAGDEPLMLANRLVGVPVLVCEDRFLAGRVAETRFDASVHVLDDGFQHLALHRDIDLVVIGAADLEARQTLPGGRLRERPTTARVADALIVEAPTLAAASQEAARLGVGEVFQLTRRLGTPVPAAPEAPVAVPGGAPVLVVCGIAHPAAFVAAVRDAGYAVAGSIELADHHPFSAGDLERIASRATAVSAECVLTTEKDMVRLRPYAPFAFPLAWVPLHVTVEPADRLRAWLVDRIDGARAARGRAT